MSPGQSGIPVGRSEIIPRISPTKPLPLSIRIFSHGRGNDFANSIRSSSFDISQISSIAFLSIESENMPDYDAIFSLIFGSHQKADPSSTDPLANDLRGQYLRMA